MLHWSLGEHLSKREMVIRINQEAKALIRVKEKVFVPVKFPLDILPPYIPDHLPFDVEQYPSGA
jgi:hypothetical protein